MFYCSRVINGLSILWDFKGGFWCTITCLLIWGEGGTSHPAMGYSHICWKGNHKRKKTQKFTWHNYCDVANNSLQCRDASFLCSHTTSYLTVHSLRTIVEERKGRISGSVVVLCSSCTDHINTLPQVLLKLKEIFKKWMGGWVRSEQPCSVESHFQMDYK